LSAEVQAEPESSPIKAQLLSQHYAHFPDVPNVPVATFLAADAIADLCHFISAKDSMLFAFPTLNDSGYFSVSLAVAPAFSVHADTKTSPLRVGKKTQPDKLASAIIRSLQYPSCEHVCVEAVGHASVHTTMLAICKVRQLLNVRQAKECFCSIESQLAPWEKDNRECTTS
jgi:stage V sporulation protein SpoVS